jgi:hypothetical protein
MREASRCANSTLEPLVVFMNSLNEATEKTRRGAGVKCKRLIVLLASWVLLVGFATPVSAGIVLLPCGAEIEINVLRGGSPTVPSGGTKDIVSKARILSGTAPPDATITDTTLTITAYDSDNNVVDQAVSPELFTLVMGRGGQGDKLSLNIPVCDPGEFFEFESYFAGTGPNGTLCDMISGRLTKTCN